MLKLIAPGRRGNKYYIARGRINGKLIEQSTGTTDRKTAEKCCAEISRTLLDAAEYKPRYDFNFAALKYIEARNLRQDDKKRIQDLCAVIGEKMLDDIVQADLVATANILFCNHPASTRNRSVMTPAAAIMHYAAQNEWCRWLRVRKFKEPTPKTRSVTDAHETWLLMATRDEPERHLLILWLFRQGDRISDVLRVRYEDCDFKTRVVHRHIAKTDTYATMPLDDDICAILRRSGHDSGLIFPQWSSQNSASRWIKKLCDNLEIKFTAHMARHTVGKRMSDAGASLRTIMAKLGHASVQSSMRYQASDIETVRAFSKTAKSKSVG